jgi:hypothetical protein
VAVTLSVTVRQVREDGSEVPADGELAAALADSAEQFAGLLTWAAGESGFLDHGEREDVIGTEGRELQRRRLQATFALDSAREERIPQVASAAGTPHGSVEAGQGRGRRRVRAGTGGHRGPDRGADRPRPAHRAPADLAAWTGDFYEERARDAGDAGDDLPDTDVVMMQADGKGIALRPEHRKGSGKADTAHPGIKKMAEVVAVADFTPAVREPEDIAAPPARRKAHPGPRARDKWVSASITESIGDMIAKASGEADRRDPERVRQRVFLVDGNKQQITAIEDHGGPAG